MNVKNKIITIIIFILSIFLLSGCELLIGDNTNNNTEEEYKIIYTADGKGYIVCEYDSNTKIKKDTEVSLQAIANDNNVFVAWYDETNNEVSTDAILNITMNKKWVLIAKFKEETQIIEEDPYDKISEIEENKEAFIKATIIVTFKNGFMIRDDSGCAIVYLGYDTDYSCGDVIEFKSTPTVFKNKLQFSSLKDCVRVGYEVLSDLPKEMSEYDISTLLIDQQFGTHVTFAGKVVKVGD